MFAICKIARTARQLSLHNNKVSINNRTMLIHSVLLALQSFVAVISTLSYYFAVLYNHESLINIFLLGVNVIGQIMICYICVTMGSDVRLRKFKMTLDMTTGVPKVRFCLKQSVVETEFEENNEEDIR